MSEMVLLKGLLDGQTPCPVLCNCSLDAIPLFCKPYGRLEDLLQCQVPAFINYLSPCSYSSRDHHRQRTVDRNPVKPLVPYVFHSKGFWRMAASIYAMEPASRIEDGKGIRAKSITCWLNHRQDSCCCNCTVKGISSCLDHIKSCLRGVRICGCHHSSATIDQVSPGWVLVLVWVKSHRSHFLSILVRKIDTPRDIYLSIICILLQGLQSKNLPCLCRSCNLPAKLICNPDHLFHHFPV